MIPWQCSNHAVNVKDSLLHCGQWRVLDIFNIYLNPRESVLKVEDWRNSEGFCISIARSKNISAVNFTLKQTLRKLQTELDFLITQF